MPGRGYCPFWNGVKRKSKVGKKENPAWHVPAGRSSLLSRKPGMPALNRRLTEKAGKQPGYGLKSRGLYP